ncbi:hypothetical protein [Spiroplasma endosymbiont of Polydrusus formosus]|uniref:hypothetical protein n=1 Tax=Spiroplasma endosymbiont of Polydrusus formosus TaxID=3139326 RepID=UPI0035B52B80
MQKYAIATVKRVVWLPNAGQAIYKKFNSSLWYDKMRLCITKRWDNSQTIGLTRIPVLIDKKFNLKLINEAFDLAMIEQNIKNSVIADAISIVVQNKFVNLECELIQAIYDYCLAYGQYEVIPFRIVIQPIMPVMQIKHSLH